MSIAHGIIGMSFKNYPVAITRLVDPSEPIKLKELPSIDFTPTKGIKKLEGTIANNNKELKALTQKIDNGIIYNESDDKIYSVKDGKKTFIAKNKTGKELNKNIFGDNIKYINADKIIDQRNSDSNISVNKLLKKFNSMEETIEELKKANRSLQQSIDSLKASGSSNKNNSIGKDDITGVETRISKLEDFVKLDPKTPSSNKEAGIGYFIHRNYEDIQSNTSQFDSIFKRLTRIEADITNNYAEFLQHRSGHNSTQLTSTLDTI